MATVALEGTGASITFGTSGFAADLITLTLPEFTREAIETTHLGTTGAKTFKSAKLYTVGDISATFDHDPRETNMITQAAETITITYPLQAGEVTAKTLSFTGFVMSWGGEEMTVDNRMITNATIKAQGAITETPATTAS
jgi:hypothetical protein